MLIRAPHALGGGKVDPRQKCSSQKIIDAQRVNNPS